MWVSTDTGRKFICNSLSRFKSWPRFTCSLTTGLNNFTGGSGNDTFDASVSNSLSTGDLLVGGAGTDTLTASLSGVTTSVNATGIETMNFTVGAYAGIRVGWCASSGVEVIADLLANGESVPEPLAEKRYSGEFRVRIPPELHRHLALMAAEQGVSLNRLASAKLAGVIGVSPLCGMRITKE